MRHQTNYTHNNPVLEYARVHPDSLILARFALLGEIPKKIPSKNKLQLRDSYYN